MAGFDLSLSCGDDTRRLRIETGEDTLHIGNLGKGQALHPITIHAIDNGQLRYTQYGISGKRSVYCSDIRRVKPEIAACNAGTLNYLKLRDYGRWAWPPMVFDNPVEKIQAFLDVMRETGTHPEFECFDVGIVRSVGMFHKA